MKEHEGHCELSAALDVDGEVIRYQLLRTDEGFTAELEGAGVNMVLKVKEVSDIKRFLAHVNLFFHKLDTSF